MLVQNMKTTMLRITSLLMILNYILVVQTLSKKQLDLVTLE